MSWLADKIEQWPTAKLLPYARNARTHSEEQVAQIAASIAEFGFTNPILAGSDGIIVAGHGRLAAAQKLAQERGWAFNWRKVETPGIAHEGAFMFAAKEAGEEMLQNPGESYAAYEQKVKLDPTQHEYLLRASEVDPRHMEVYSIEKVSGLQAGRSDYLLYEENPTLAFAAKLGINSLAAASTPALGPVPPASSTA